MILKLIHAIARAWQRGVHNAHEETNSNPKQKLDAARGVDIETYIRIAVLPCDNGTLLQVEGWDPNKGEMKHTRYFVERGGDITDGIRYLLVNNRLEQK